MFKVSFKHRAEKQFDDLTPDFKQKIYDGLGRLSQEGLAHSNVRKIKRTKLGYRLRVGRWRIFFAFFDKEKHIEVIDIFLKKGKEDYQRRIHLLK